IGHIRAGDQQSQSDRAEQRQQCLAHIAHGHFLQRDGARAVTSLVGILLLQSRRDGVQLGLRLLNRRARFEPTNHSEVVSLAQRQRVAAIVHLIIRHDLTRTEPVSFFTSGARISHCPVFAAALFVTFQVPFSATSVEPFGETEYAPSSLSPWNCPSIVTSTWPSGLSIFPFIFPSAICSVLKSAVCSPS